MKKDDFGDRMKHYEALFSSQKTMPLLPVLARLDGVCFHSFAAGLNRPYDTRLSQLMADTTKYLVAETNARVGYTQSDEITLCWFQDEFTSQIYFNGRVSKLTSVLAAKATAFFNKKLPTIIPEKQDRFPVFDCRVWNVPNAIEAVNVFLWREKDAIKNSISMAASDKFSHKELYKVNGKTKIQMLLDKGVDWNALPDFFRYGTYVRKIPVVSTLTEEQLQKIPESRRINATTVFERNEFRTSNFPIRNMSNRKEFLFERQEPIERIQEDAARRT